MSAYVLSNGQRVYPAFVLNDADGGGIVTPPASFRLADGTQVTGIVLVDADGNIAPSPRTDAEISQLTGYLPRQSGEYYDNTTAVAGSVTTVALAADRLYAVPYFVPEPDTIDRVHINVTTTGTATEFRFLVYACDATTGRPGALTATLGTAAIGGSTGLKTVTGLSQVLSGGDFPYVWLAVEANGTVTVSAVSPLESAIGTDGLSPYGHIYVAHTYADAAPNPFGSGTRAATGPRIVARIA